VRRWGAITKEAEYLHLRGETGAALERNLILGRQLAGSRPPAAFDLRFKRAHESNRAGDVAEDQQTLVVVQDGIVVGEALVISDIVEGLKDRDAELMSAVVAACSSSR
jgi:hypothetical protein